MLREFLGIGGYTRTPEGFFSWQHLVFVTSLTFLMIALAVLLGKRHKNAPEREKMRVLFWTAVVVDGAELFKTVVLCTTSDNPLQFLYCLPLFLCTIQMMTLPLSVLSRGRVREACLDFIFLFGMVGALLGLYGAAQNYNAYPVLSMDNVVSGITHAGIGFASLYIPVCGLSSMKKKNVPVCAAILLSFCALAYAVNVLIDYNYMFLMRGDGTPYDIAYNLVGGDPVLYPLFVVALFLVYMAGFYAIYYTAHKKKQV